MEKWNKSYTYRRFQHESGIRLIEVLPELHDGHIACAVRQLDGSSSGAAQPGYHALSYLWGDPQPAQSVFLTDDAHEYYFPQGVHENLWRFLTHVWEQKLFGRLFWTDFLCLDQTNREEIAQQIPRMGRIYAAAEEVVIWLGHDRQGEGALKMLQDWCAVDLDKDGASQHDDSYDSFYDTVKEGVFNILLLPYWSRVWIVQEVVLARKARVQYGNVALGFDEFCSNVDPFRRERKPELQYQPTAWSLRELRTRNTKKALWEIVQEFELCRSTKTADKIYGFLGLIDESSEQGRRAKEHLKVDYDKEPFEVFWDALFEAGTPCDKLNAVLLSLGHMLVEDLDFLSLQRYARSSRTLPRQHRFVHIALGVFNAANVLKLHVSSNWDDVVDGLLKLAAAAPPMTEVQNAAMVGLALTQYREHNHSMWKAYWRCLETSDLSPWRCAFHRFTGEDQTLVPSGEELHGCCPRVSVNSDWNTLQRACSEYSPDCDGSVIFGMPDINFHLAISAKSGLPERSEVMGRIYLDMRDDSPLIWGHRHPHTAVPDVESTAQNPISYETFFDVITVVLLIVVPLCFCCVISPFEE
ncbi:heterokaryon incompatibility protein-domain-containing protein [Biscogniauxia mediterranea]|nr:heterokaryon incompatibility protein-domain-containing protein [Biscogniauxia mediterranea]